MTTKFEELRAYIFENIKKALEESTHHKSYEGRMTIVYPDYFQEGTEEGLMRLELACYILGPSRHYEWTGKTIDECCEKAFVEIRSWIEEKELENENQP